MQSFHGFLYHFSPFIINHGTLFHLEQHFRKLFGALDALHPPFSSNERRKSTLPANDKYFPQNQTFSQNQKYMTPKQNH